MANKIVLKKSSVAAKVPLSADLDVGEIAVNLVDQKLYSKKTDGTVIVVGNGIGGSGTVTSVGGTGTVNGITLTGTVTTSGNLTLGGTLSGVSLTTQVSGTLSLANGGTNATSAADARTNLDVPTRTGGNASGTWGISVTGNAATATTATNQSGGSVSATTGSFSGQLSVAQSSTLIGNGINLNAAGSGYLRGTNNDGNSSTIANVQLMSWDGIGFSPSITGQAVPQGENAVWISCRTGTINARSTITGLSFIGATGATNNLFIGRNSTAPNYNSISLNGNPADSPNMGMTGGGGSDTTLYINAPGQITFRTNSFAQTSTLTAAGFENPNSVRAPIFYDSNNTGYYIDPTGGTSLRTVGDWRSDSGGWTGEFAGKIQYHANNWYFQYQTDFIFRNSGGGTAFYGDASGNTFASASSRAPIFYDSNDTNYYCDPASTSVLTAINTWGEIAPRRNDVQSLLRSYNTSAGQPLQFYLDHNGGNVNIGNNRGVVFGGGSYWEIANSVRAPIFYDSNDTGFYVDPTASSRLNGSLHISINNATGGGLILADDGDFVDLNDGYGALRFSQGVRIHSGNRTGGAVITLGSNGVVTANTDVRAPIFYDNNDTAWYCDPNSLSRFNRLTVPSNVGSGTFPVSVSSTDRGIIFDNSSGSGIPLYFLVNSSATLSGYVVCSGGSTSYITSSDYRMKENDVNINKDTALAKIMSLRPVTFDWKQEFGGQQGIGFIAHELQAVAPECVDGQKDAVNENGTIKPQGVDTSWLIPSICSAMQKQQELIEQLMAEVAALKGN